MQQKNQLKSGSGRQVKVNPKKWYIVLIKRNQADKLKVIAINKFKFPDPKTAQMFLDSAEELKELFIIKMKGKKLLEYGIKLSGRAGKYTGINTNSIPNYKYPPGRITFQDKKSYRTTLRRQMRMYGKRINDKFY